MTSNIIYDPISAALGLSPIDFQFDLNQYEHSSFVHTPGMKGLNHSQESRLKMSEKRKGNPDLIARNRRTAEKRRGTTSSEETKAKIRIARSNCTFSEEHKKNLSKAGTGRPVSEETREKMRLKNSIKSECPHCGLIGGGSAMKRYHFDKCKSI